MEYINYNGRIFKSADAVVVAANRGLRYGDGLFETIKMINGKIIFEEDHFERLWKGLSVLEFEPAGQFSKDLLVKGIKGLASKNKCEKAARIRLNVFRGSGGLYDPINHSPNYIIEATALPLSSEFLNSNGLVAGVYTEAIKCCDMLANLKHNNFLVYAMAAIYAKKEKWNDAIVVNNHGRIADSTIANVFLVKEDKIFTPALEEGCVAGIVRENLILFLEKNGWVIEEKPISKDMLLAADEVFLTNSIYDIKWVKQIEGSFYTNRLTQKIYTAFTSTIY